MNRPLALIAISTATLLLACDKRAKQAPAPTPTPVEPAPGGTVAPAPGPPMPIACIELHIAMAKDKLTHGREVDVELPYGNGALDPIALGAALGDRAKKCIGPVLVTATDDAGYQDIITVLDVARGQGFTEVGFGEQSMHNEPARPFGKDELAKVPVVVVSKTEVTIGDTRMPLGAADLQQQVQAALGAAKTAGALSTAVVMQADVSTTGKTLNAITRGANQAGFGNLLFAVKSR